MYAVLVEGEGNRSLRHQRMDFDLELYHGGHSPWHTHAVDSIKRCNGDFNYTNS